MDINSPPRLSMVRVMRISCRNTLTTGTRPSHVAARINHRHRGKIFEGEGGFCRATDVTHANRSTGTSAALVFFFFFFLGGGAVVIFSPSHDPDTSTYSIYFISNGL